MEPPLLVHVLVGGERSALDPDTLAEMTLRLQGELRELPTEGVQPVVADALPAGAKGIDPVAIGMFAVKVAPAVLTPVIGLVKSWIERQPDHKLTIKVVVGDRSIELGHTQRLSATDLASLARSLTETLRRE